MILADALCTAVVALERLPNEHRPDSNLEDMKAILAAWCDPGTVTVMLAQAKCRLDQVTGDAVTAVYRSYGIDIDGEAA
jgi:hypothetical protein